MAKKLVVGGVAALGAVLSLGFVRWQLSRQWTEEPAYDVESRRGSFEIRRYAPCVRAETTVDEGPWREALSLGFRRLAGYIFGGNDPGTRLAMTVPVTAISAGGDAALSTTAPGIPSSVARRPSGERIAMTTPVTASIASVEHPPSRVNGTAPAATDEGPWTIAFTMPRHRDIASLPAPRDGRIHIRTVPARRVAVLRFSGRFTPERIAEKKRELLKELGERGLEARGIPEFAGYDPPGTLPFLRRNEVWVGLD